MIQQLSRGGSWKWVSQFSRIQDFPPVLQLTYSDLLSGRNYHYFGMKKLLFQIASWRNSIIFASKQIKQVKKIPWWDRIVPFNSDLTGTWIQNRDTVLGSVTPMAKSKNSHVFLLALGPLSNILISNMWEVNPHNTYIDVGSAMNEFHGLGTQARAYMRNPACQAVGPTCTPMSHKPNLKIGSSTDFRVRRVEQIDKLRCCTPVMSNCSLKLRPWYPPVHERMKKRITCKGILSKEFVWNHIVGLCQCGNKASLETIVNCVMST